MLFEVELSVFCMIFAQIGIICAPCIENKAKHETLAGARAWLREPEGLSAPQDTVNLSLRILYVNRLCNDFVELFFIRL